MDNDGLKILVVDDEPNICTGLSKGLKSEAGRIDVASSGEEGWDRFSEHRHEIVITDLRLPGEIDGLELVRLIHEKQPETHVIVITAYGTVETAVEAMRRGAYDFVTKPIDLNVIRHQVQQAAEHRRLLTENRRLRDQLAEVGTISEIIGNCKATHDVLRQIRQVAQTDATVLILGESGTGKELTARAIHQMSQRHDKPFITVNMGALPDSLLESELFGHEKGAFTDAVRQKIGSFESASEGTIFLDEITETTTKSQVELLRVLEAREIRRVGGDKPIPIDVRIVSATNKDFNELIRSGDFREDLYYRLNVIPIRVPSLRERREDIPLLAEHFLSHFCKRYGREPKQMSAEAIAALIAFGWPGNIRQLRNFMERLVVTVSTDVIHLTDLPTETLASPSVTCGTLSSAVEDAERNAILAALANCNYHREKTARLLNISIRSLHYKMSRYGLH